VRPGENGWLVPAGDIEALADAMRACLQAPPDQLNAMGAAGRERVLQRHGADVEAAKLAACFEQSTFSADMPAMPCTPGKPG